jgi:hypothetical protein
VSSNIFSSTIQIWKIVNDENFLYLFFLLMAKMEKFTKKVKIEKKISDIICAESNKENFHWIENYAFNETFRI